VGPRAQGGGLQVSTQENEPGQGGGGGRESREEQVGKGLMSVDRRDLNDLKVCGTMC
jgi:hypothetical protein